jgi:phospholipid/cholesterol/gamma-HCH transport system substrate-binding protein
MKNTLETRLGIFVALAVIAAVLILEIVGGPVLFETGYHLRALFNSAQDLKQGDSVKIAGVTVGRVEKITLDETNNKVLVTMKMRKKVEGIRVEVHTDSIAMIKFTGLLGQNFVAIGFGSRNSPIASDGAMLSTQEQPDLSAMMTKIDNVATGVENLTRSFTGVKIDQLLGPLISFLQDSKGPLTTTFSNLQAVSTQIREGKGTVGRLIFEDALYTTALDTVSNFDKTGAELQDTFADVRKLIAEVDSGQGTVGKLLHDEKLYNETTESMVNLKEILQKINQGQGTIGKVVNDQELYKNAKLTLQKLDKATEGLEDQGPLSVLGIVVNKLF